MNNIKLIDLLDHLEEKQAGKTSAYFTEVGNLLKGKRALTTKGRKKLSSKVWGRDVRGREGYIQLRPKSTYSKKSRRIDEDKDIVDLIETRKSHRMKNPSFQETATENPYITAGLGTGIVVPSATAVGYKINKNKKNSKEKRAELSDKQKAGLAVLLGGAAVGGGYPLAKKLISKHKNRRYIRNMPKMLPSNTGF